ncbi:MAG: MFS transporter [Chloroflexi bacterium]|nr:MFS transporter [Chloroflexota bacterium]
MLSAGNRVLKRVHQKAIVHEPRPTGADIKTGDQGVYYGWIIVAASFAVTLTLGESFWSFGVFFKPLENEFNWSRSLVSSGYTAFLIGYGISVIASGRLADRYKPRNVLLLSAVLAGVGIALCSQVQSVGQLRVFLFIAGLGAGATWSVPGSVVQRWFNGRKRAGLALGIVTSGVGIGALVFAPLINYLILNYGWRNAYLIVGILFTAIIALAALFIKHAPPDAAPGRGQKPDVTRAAADGGWTTGKTLLSPSFLVIVFVISLGSFTFNATSVHLVPQASDAGISATTSAAALGLMGGFSVPGRIIGGLATDRVSWQKLLALSNLGMMLSLGWLLFLNAPWMLYSFVFFFGLCTGVRSPAQIGIVGAFFGMRSLGELIGITSAVSQLIAAFSPYLAGLIFDVTGSYTLFFFMLAATLLCAVVLAMTIRKPSAMPAKPAPAAIAR